MASPTWELNDAPAAPIRLLQGDLVRMILNRQVSLQASVRAAQSHPWTNIAAMDAFSPACPAFNLGPKPAKVQQATGVFTVGSNPENLLAIARMTRTNSAWPKLGFFVPTLVDQPRPPFSTPGALFQMWDGMFLGAVCESQYLRPQMFLHLYLVAFNLSRGLQRHVLVAGGYPIPPDQLSALDLTVPPFRWTVRHLVIPMPPTPGDHEFEFRTTSSAAKAGKAIAAGVLSLGTFIYIPGHKGFSLTVRVLDRPTIKLLDDFEGAVLRATGKSFTDADTDHATKASGGDVPRKDFMERFRQYLWYNPGRTLKALSGENADDAYAELLGRYMWEEWGDDVNLPGAPETPGEPPPGSAR
jgi:hypothetical protein